MDKRFTKEEIQWLKRWGIEKIPFDDFNLARMHNSVYYSFPNEHDRYAHLGDAVIYLVDSERNYQSKEKYSRGRMDGIRQGHIKKEFLSKVFGNIEFKNILISKVNPSDEKKRMRAELFESLFGALYNTCGYKYCQKFWDKILKSMENT